MIQAVEKQYNYTILVFRLIAITCIIFCHIATELGIASVAQLLDVGVQFFLFISGYLYAFREIEDPRDWLKKRYLRVTVPCLIYVAICFVLSLIFKWTFSPTSLVLYPLNAEGYYHVFEFIPQIQLITGTQHLWFITALFLCYLLMIAVKKKEEWIQAHRAVICVAAFLISILLTLFGFRADLIFVYYLGYFVAGVKNEQLGKAIKGKEVIASFALMVIFVAGRLWMKSYCDRNGDHLLYTNAVIPWTYIAITIFMFCLLMYLVPRIQKTVIGGKVIRSRLFQRYNALSFYLYITHYVFLGTELSVFRSSFSILVCIPLFLINILIAATLLEKISGGIMRKRK